MIVCHVKLSKYRRSSFRNRLSYLEINFFFEENHAILNCYAKHITCNCISFVFDFIVLKKYFLSLINKSLFKF